MLTLIVNQEDRTHCRDHKYRNFHNCRNLWLIATIVKIAKFVVTTTHPPPPPWSYQIKPTIHREVILKCPQTKPSQRVSCVITELSKWCILRTEQTVGRWSLWVGMHSVPLIRKIYI